MKWGLGHPYERVEYLPEKIRAYIDLTKPASSVGLAVGFFLASIFYFVYVNPALDAANIGSKLSSMIYVSLTIFLAHSASQAMNMAEDAEMDRNTPHKQNRPIPSGVVEEEEARALSWVLVFIALAFAYLKAWKYGVFITLLIFMGVFYNLQPIRAKERIVSIPWQAVSRGLLSFPIVWSAYGDPFAIEAWALGLFMFFYVLGFQNSADIIDRHVDEEYGISTLIVKFGVRKTLLISFGCSIAMATVAGLAVWMRFIPIRFLTILLILPFCFYMIASMWRNPHRISDTTGNHPAWLWYYMGVASIVGILLITEVSFKYVA